MWYKKIYGKGKEQFCAVRKFFKLKMPQKYDTLKKSRNIFVTYKLNNQPKTSTIFLQNKKIVLGIVFSKQKDCVSHWFFRKKIVLVYDWLFSLLAKQK